jgi:hypothetical protein
MTLVQLKLVMAGLDPAIPVLATANSNAGKERGCAGQARA